MENSAQALKMAAAVMVFVIAISVAIMAFSKARSTSDVILGASDKRSQYDAYYDPNQYLTNDKSYENRIVGLETIIPTLYKYDKEDYRVVFKDGTRGGYDKSTGKFSTDIDYLPPLKIYTTNMKETEWNIDEYKTSYSYNLNQGTNISVFDISEEIQRNEPWTISPTAIKDNLDRVFSGAQGENYDYSGNPLTQKDNRYVELIGRVNISTKNVDPNSGEILGSNITTTKTVITYILIPKI